MPDEKGQSRYLRTEVTWSVTMRSSQGEEHGATRNISFGGAYVQCSKSPPRDEIFWMEIKQPERLPLELTFEVAWIDTRGVGIRFLEISEENQRFLYRLLFDL